VKLRPVQVEAAGWLTGRASGGILADVGSGKSAVALEALRGRRALIVAPKRPALYTWPDEIAKWSPGTLWAFPHQNPNPAAAIWITWPERLESVLAMPGLPEILLLDELHIWRNGSSTKRFKTLRAALPRFTHRWGMTATPAPRSVENLWGQCYLLDSGQALGKYVTGFRKKWFYQKPMLPYTWFPHLWAEREIYDRINECDLMHRMAMPPPSLYEQSIVVPLPDDVLEACKELEREFYLTLGRGAVAAANAAVLGGKLRQLVGGAIYTTNLATGKPSGKWEDIHDAKLGALEGLIDSLQGVPLLLMYEYQHELARIRDRFGCERWLGAGAPDEGETVRAWCAGEIQLLPAQSQSASLGLNLQAGGQHVCWFTLPWSLDLLIQGNGRLRPHLQPVFAHYLVAEDTIEDRAVLPSWLATDDVQTRFLHNLETKR
jgi:hypothetical protein